jgi:Zn-dependent protease with chaperone function
MGIPIPEFKVLLYGPSLHPSGTRARARFEGKALAVTAREGAFLVAPERITLRSGGFDGRQWLIAWAAQEGTYSALLQSEEALEAFIQLAPPELARQLHQVRTTRSRSTRSFWLILAALALLALLTLGLLWTNADRLSRWAVSHISVEQEMRLGELGYARLRPTLKLIEQGPVATAVTAIGKRLSGESIYPYRFHVAVDPAINAYALPGGHIIVNTGLLQAADSAAEVAGVLAHEISHVELRHTLRNLMHGMGWRAILGVATGDFSGGYWGDMAARLANLGYSRELETEADRDGLEILRRARVAPHGMELFFVKLSQRQTDLPALLSSHPADGDRLAALRAAIARQPLDDLYPLHIDWESVKVEL